MTRYQPAVNSATVIADLKETFMKAKAKQPRKTKLSDMDQRWLRKLKREYNVYSKFIDQDNWNYVLLILRRLIKWGEKSAERAAQRKGGKKGRA